MEADREAVGQVCRAALDLKQLAKHCVFGVPGELGISKGTHGGSVGIIRGKKDIQG